jgi:cytochrome c-type biogenesis protein
LNFLGVLKWNLFRGAAKFENTGSMGFFSALLFGMIFSVGWTPCVGAFLGSALMLASQQGHVLEGMGMLLCYSLGLGVPFLISAVLIDQLKGAFNLIKRNYAVVNKVCGSLLILVGVLMATGLLTRMLNTLN